MPRRKWNKYPMSWGLDPVRPGEPATGDPKRDVYVFEAPVSIKREQGDAPVGFMDLYKKESFILEANDKCRPNQKTPRARPRQSMWSMSSMSSTTARAPPG